MRAYSSRSFEPARKSKPWKWFLFGLILGLVGGIVLGTIVNVRKPVELVISTPSPPAIEEMGDIASEDLWSESSNISVRTPKPNATVTSPLLIEGLERTFARPNLSADDGNVGGFEQNVMVRLRDGKGRELASVATTGDAPELGIYGTYRAELTFEKPTTNAGTLEVFQHSPQDGSEIDMVKVPVRFK